MSISHPKRSWNENAVFLGVTEPLHGPKDIVPCFVWLEADKECQDFRREMLVGLSIIPMTFDIGKIVSKGEIGLGIDFGIDLGGSDASTGDGTGVPGLIEDAAEIVGGVEQDAGLASPAVRA